MVSKNDDEWVSVGRFLIVFGESSLADDSSIEQDFTESIKISWWKMVDHSVAGNVFTRTNARILLRGQYVLFIGGLMTHPTLVNREKTYVFDF